MTRLTPKQEMHVKNVQIASDAYKRAKAHAIERARRIAMQEISDYQAKLDLEVRLAFEAGVSKRRIGEEGMGTSAGKTVLDSLARTEESAEAIVTSFDPLADRYSLNDERTVLTVTLDGPEFDQACRDEEWAPEEARSLGFHEAFFTVDGGVLTPASSDFMPEHGRRHPVVVWVLHNDAEALTWLREVAA